MEKDAGGINIQDQYLGKARKERAWLTVILNSGKKIGGRIVSFDRYTVILDDRGSEQMVFKHAIATVSVSRSFSNAIDFNKAQDPRNRPPAARRQAGGSDPGQESPPGGAPAGGSPAGGSPAVGADRPDDDASR